MQTAYMLQLSMLAGPHSAKTSRAVKRERLDAVIQVNVTTDEDLGTIYSVAVPVKRVKPTARLGMDDEMEVCLWPCAAASSSAGQRSTASAKPNALIRRTCT